MEASVAGSAGPVVDLWWARLTAAHAGLRDLLPEAERPRTLEPLPPADEGRRLVAAVLLQYAVARATGWPGTTGPGAPGIPASAVDRTCDSCGQPHGRPVIPGGPHVSVSHAGALIVVATCWPCRIGVDVERDPGDSPDPTIQRCSGTIRDWTHREARVKAGLTTPAGGASPHHTVDLDPPLAGYRAALVVAGAQSPTLRLHQWPDPAAPR